MRAAPSQDFGRARARAKSVCKLSRPDLADRAIFLSLPPIGEQQRRFETELWREFEIARRASWAPCSTRWCMGYGGSIAFTPIGCRGWLILPSGRRPVKPHSGPPAPSLAPTRPLSGPLESIIDADPVAACVREIMAERSSWTGSAADLLRAGADRNSEGVSRLGTGWPKHPRALAGRLRRAQTFLRALGIEVAFGREGRAGSRVIRMHTTLAHTVSTVSSAGKHGLGAGPPPPQPADDVCGNNYRPDLVGPCPIGQAPVTAADDADGADAKAAFR